MKFLAFILLLPVQSFGLEVICTCDEPCKQVVFNIEEPLMTVDTETDQIRGAALVITSKVKDQTVYKLGSMVLIKEGKSFRMLGTNRLCSRLVLN